MLLKIFSILPGLMRVISNGTPLIVIFLFARDATVQELGLLNYFLALITILGVLTDFGLPEAVQKFLAKKAIQEQIISITVSLEVTLVLIASTIFVAIDYFTDYSLSKGNMQLMLAIIIFSSCNSFIYIYNGLNKHKKTIFFFALTSILFLSLSVILHYLFKYNVVISFLMGRAISWAITLIVIFADLVFTRLVSLKLKFNKEFIKFSFKTLLISLSYVFFNNWDSVAITYILGEEMNGIYKSIALIAFLPNLIGVVLQTKFLTIFSRFFEEGNDKNILHWYKKNLLVILTMALIFFLASLLLGTALFDILTNKQSISSSSAIIFPILILASFAYSIIQWNNTVLLAINKEGFASKVAILHTIVIIILGTVILYIFKNIHLLASTILCINILFMYISSREIFLFERAKV